MAPGGPPPRPTPASGLFPQIHTNQQLFTLPPPAYSVHNTMAANGQVHVSFNNNNGAESDDDFDEDDGNEHRAAYIQIHIKAPVVIVGDGNLVTVEPSVTANKIAMGIVTAMRAMSVGSHGVPMIDEDGRPRPLRVSVTAEMRIEGSRNLIGEKAVMEKIRPGLDAIATAAAARQGNGSMEAKKRERAGSEPLEAETKRTRRG